VIDNPGASPSFTNLVGAMTFSTPYRSIRFDDGLVGRTDSALIDFRRVVPALGSTSITWSYATGTSLAEVRGDEAAARDAMQPPSVAISSPVAGATVTSSPVKVSGSESAGSGVKTVTVNGVGARVSGGSWRALVPLTRGRNTIVATVTSNAGGTAKASERVTYAPPPRMKSPDNHHK
jgi:hypothetical protein